MRGDIAFVQSMLETGWFGFAGSQIPPDANNYAGIYAFDGRTGARRTARTATPSPSRCMGTPQHGVLVQIQLLRSYADPTTKNLPDRFISAPSDRVGARADLGVLRRQQLPVRQADLGVGRRTTASASSSCTPGARRRAAWPARACRTRRRQHGHDSGTGYWMATDESHVYTFGDAHVLRRPAATCISTSRSSAASRCRPATGYWLLGRDGGIFTFGDAPSSTARPAAMHLNKPVNGMERTDDDKGYWLVADDGGIFTFGDAQFYGSTGAHAPEPAGARHGAHASAATATGCSPRRRHLHASATRKFYGSLGGTQLDVAGRVDAAHRRRARATGC